MANGHKPEKFEQFNSAHVFDVVRYLTNSLCIYLFEVSV